MLNCVNVYNSFTTSRRKQFFADIFCLNIFSYMSLPRILTLRVYLACKQSSKDRHIASLM